ncbi:MAG: transposase [Verrucomicrobiaceae bacterium]|nr:transposase [Verrucomicrobiaceae bacterium]
MRAAFHEVRQTPSGKKPKAPEEGPRPKDQYNFTDPESRIMKDGGSFEQCYNAQAAVEVETMLIVGGEVSDAPNDKEQLEPALNSVSPAVGSIGKVLADSGYYSAKAVAKVEGNGEPGRSSTLA